MASLQDVLDALVAETRAAIALVSYPALVYSGWPTQANLRDVVAKGIQSHVSVYALPGERNTTRFARELSAHLLTTVGLSVEVQGSELTFGGSVQAPGNILVAIGTAPPLVYPVSAGMSLEMVAQGVAFALSGAGIRGVSAAASGPTVSVNGSPLPAIDVRLGGTGSLVRLLRQQEKHFMVTVWAPAPDVRENLAEALDARLGTMDRLPLPDFPGRIRYQSTFEEEPQERLPVFRRSLTYSLEWARTETVPAAQVISPNLVRDPSR